MCIHVVISGHNYDLTYLQVVILIDEYDTPLNEAKSAAARSELIEMYAAFFRVIKSMGSSIRLAYVTGITSYGMAGIYS
jgi:hypothetical protein